MKETFLVGVAGEVVSPELGTPLYGYAFHRPARAVADDLMVKAIAVSQGDVQGILISADVVSISNELTETLRQKISAETGVPEMHISISATHTHSGPAMKSAAGWGVANNAYLTDCFSPQTIKAAKAAFAAMVPAVMGVGTTQSFVGVNRREQMEDGTILLGQNPYGIFDPTMTVISFATPEGKPIANLIHYGCHGTAAGRNPDITRDWPGVMVDGLERETGAITLFFNGAEGDVGPRLSNGQTTGDTQDFSVVTEPTGDIAYAREIGMVAAVDAITAYRNIKGYTDVDFRVVSGTMQLPYDPQYPYEEAKAKLAQLNSKETLVQVELRQQGNLTTIVDMYEKGQSFETHMVLPQTLFAFNSVVLVPFAFEMFSEIALRLRQYSPFAHTLGLCNTNGSNFYLPTRDQMVRGGYEVEIFRYGNIYKLTDDADDRIIQENLKLIKKFNHYTVQKKHRFTHG